MVLVPAVVDLAGTVPVVAAGGIADGRGIAAALALGVAGCLSGTRFLATPEMSIDGSWKDRIVSSSASDAVKVTDAARVMPPFTLPQTGLPFVARGACAPRSSTSSSPIPSRSTRPRWYPAGGRGAGGRGP